MAIRKLNTVSTRSFVTLMLIVAVAASGIFPAFGSFHTFQLNELYSNASGSVQFIELVEGFGANGQQFLAGHTLIVAQGTTTRTYTFPNDLPSGNTAGMHVLIATPAFAMLGIVTPDYIVPTRASIASATALCRSMVCRRSIAAGQRALIRRPTSPGNPERSARLRHRRRRLRRRCLR